MGTLISNYISEEQGTDTYRISDDSMAARTNNQAGDPLKEECKNQKSFEHS